MGEKVKGNKRQPGYHSVNMCEPIIREGGTEEQKLIIMDGDGFVGWTLRDIFRLARAHVVKMNIPNHNQLKLFFKLLQFFLFRFKMLKLFAMHTSFICLTRFK